MGKVNWLKLDETLISIQNGYSGKQNDSGENNPISRIETLQDDDLDINRIKFAKLNEDEIAKYRYDKGDLIFSHINSFEKVGKVALFNNQIEGLIHGVNILRLKFKNDIYPKYAYYYFLSDLSRNEYEKHIKRAINQASLNQKNLKSISFPFQSLPEQQRIVAKLDGLFAKIDQAIGLLEENLAHTQALMGSVLDEEFGRLKKFNKPLMSFCENPKKDMVGGPFGSNLKASEYVDKGYPIIRLQNVDRFKFKEKNIMFVTEAKADFLSSHSYVSGDIVMTKLGDPLGKCCIVEDVHGVNRGVISSDIIRIRIDESKHYKPYVVAGINSEYFIKQLKSKTQGSTRPRVTLKEVRAMQLPMLQRKDQIIVAERIDSILDIQSKVIETQTQKLTHLKALKSSLLDQAFKGEL